ncbi:MAG: hypothetical protein ACT4OX_10925 [Actinomycetota bacterium]
MTVIRFKNDGTEFHEIAVIPIPDSETRSLEELLELPEEETADSSRSGSSSRRRASPRPPR